MENHNKILLSNKLKTLSIKLQAQDFVKNRISFHWLKILDSIISSGMRYEILNLCNVTEEAYPSIVKAIEDLGHPALSSSLVHLGGKDIIDDFYTKYPSIDQFKYVVNFPKINLPNQEFHEIINQKEKLPDFKTNPVFFLSPDWSPLIKLDWNDIIEKGKLVFSDIPLSFIFSDSSFSNILFKSLEDDWYVVKSS